MKIEVKIEIANIENWSYDWSNKQSIKTALNELDRDIAHVVSGYAGILFHDIKVESKFIVE